MFNDVKKAYMIGIGGCGMRSLTSILLDMDIEVSGSDLDTENIFLQELIKKRKINVNSNHKTTNITKDINLVVYSSAIDNGNKELVEARKLGIRCISRAECLSNITKDFFTFLVVGTHGKTTVSSLLVHIFKQLNININYAIGADLQYCGDSGGKYNKNAECFIVEGDESDGSVSLFKSNVLIINNIELDHTDRYKNINEYKSVFIKCIKNILTNGMVIGCGDDDNVIDISQNHNKKNRLLFYYGYKEYNNYKIINSKRGNFEIDNYYEKVTLSSKLPGVYNQYNIASAYLTAMIFHDDRRDDIIDAINTFNGPRRRLEYIDTVRSIKIYDDYAHHPSALRNILNVVMDSEFKGDSRLILVFQPYRYSRFIEFYDEFIDVLKIADRVIITNPYFKDVDIYDMSIVDKMVSDVNGISQEDKCIYIDKYNDTVNYLMSILIKDDIVLTASCGDVYKVGRLLIDRLSNSTELGNI